MGRAQRYEKVGQSESESDWSRDEKKDYSQDEGETDVELSQVSDCRKRERVGWAGCGLPPVCVAERTVAHCYRPEQRCTESRLCWLFRWACNGSSPACALRVRIGAC